MGEWYYRKIENPDPPKHKHDYPTAYHHNIKNGDIWRCSCMTYFQAHVCLQEGSQVQYNLTWRGMWPEETKDFK